jgi:isopenicillin N synthase-like dioxygenase
MATSFSSLPIVDLAVLSSAETDPEDLLLLSQKLYDVFSSTGFAYLINSPLSFSHEEVFRLTSDFFRISGADKECLSKRTFIPTNTNTYRGYFPTQPHQNDNLKEGFEVGGATSPKRSGLVNQKFDLAEPNVWPNPSSFVDGRERTERLHEELQSLAATLLSLLAVSLGKSAEYFASYLVDSLSTLRLLHYPPQQSTPDSDTGSTKLCCTPHTDSGVLTLLHQDETGGLEVLNAAGDWVAAPYVSGSIVVNIGDLMAKVSGGRFIATMHRVRTSQGPTREDGLGRFSVPFFFEPGEACVVQNVDGGESVIYGQYVR